MVSNDKKYSKVLCAVRGQLESQATAKKAIRIALEHGASLHYCYILDLEFLKDATPTLSPIRHIYQQLEEMSEFALSILSEETQQLGVQDVAYTILKGDIPDALLGFAREMQADVIVLGSPIMKSMGRNVFTPKQFEAFIEQLREQLGIDVVEVRPASENDLTGFPGAQPASD